MEGDHRFNSERVSPIWFITALCVVPIGLYFLLSFLSPLIHRLTAMNISAIYVYPVKSLRGVKVTEAVATSHGFQHDRSFMLLQKTADGYKNMAVSDYPEMTQFLQEMDSHTITVTYIAYGDTSKQTSLQIPLTPKTEDLDPIDINMHSSPTSAFAMPSQYNDWFTACFGYPVQLIYLGPNRRSVLFKDMQPAPPSPITKFLQRIVPSTSIPYLPKLLGPHEAEPSKITFADCAPYLLCSQTSLDDVSSRLPAGTQMDMTKFRPNIVLDGALQAFQEDHWQRVAIGTNIELSLRHNCVRCKSINVDYRTGRPGEGAQGTVLKKLQGDRRVDVGARWSPVFGRYGFWGKGREGGEVVRVGDRVQVRRVDEGFSVWCWPGIG